MLTNQSPSRCLAVGGAAKYVDKILRGANLDDLPIAGPTEFTMSANRNALKDLGLSMPSDLAAQVNEWID